MRGNTQRTREKMKTHLHLLCHSRELEDVESLVIHGGTLVDVDDHTCFTSTTEKALQVVGQLAFPEGHMLKQPEGGNRKKKSCHRYMWILGMSVLGNFCFQSPNILKNW